MVRAIVDEVDAELLTGPERVTLGQIDRLGIDIPPILKLIVYACYAALGWPV